jgi:transcriptional regulator with XRE-family HTH domain
MNIKELRLKNGYSQEELANLSGLSTRTIQRIEKDNKGSKESLSAIANIFELKYEELIEYIKKEEIPNDSSKYDKKLIVFIVVNIMLFIINMTTSPENLWFIYPLLGWGIPFFIKRYRNNIN